MLSVEVILTGNSKNIVSILERIKDIETYDGWSFTKRISKDIETFSDPNISEIGRVYINYSSKKNYEQEFYIIHEEFKDVIFEIMTKAKGYSSVIFDKKKKKRIFFNSLIAWRVYRGCMKFNSRDVYKYLIDEYFFLAYEVDDVYGFIDGVMESEKGLKFTSEYTLKKFKDDIASAYEYLRDENRL